MWLEMLALSHIDYYNNQIQISLYKKLLTKSFPILY